MFFHRRRGWGISESKVTPESAVLGRRKAIITAGAATATLAASEASAQWRIFSAPVNLAPRRPMNAKQNPMFKPERDITSQNAAETYNNFYEFGFDKDVVGPAQALPTNNWTLEINGLVEKPFTIGMEDLIKKVNLEERIYRHRCVEAWAMTVPWIGFPLAELVKMAAPTSKARYLSFTSLADRSTMPGLKKAFYPWPYIEGLTLEEATNELAFISVGMYGQNLAPQNGAPLRLTLPWKYGFKSAKSLVRISFTEQQPNNFWQQLQPDEYGFWANVNPDVPHPRWSQARERLLGSGDMVPTKIWNGYGEFVAGLYTNLQTERLFV